MTIKKILWPTDFSTISNTALPHVKSLTEKYDAEVHVLYVIEDMSQHDGWYGSFKQQQVDELMEQANITASTRLNYICEKCLQGWCPRYIKHIAVGDSAQEILKLIKKEKVDLVVMASHGEKGHFRFGSVAEKVLKNASVPVTIIPAEPSSP
jgi:nucleotide-binding universal stress UspA family protein